MNSKLYKSTSELIRLDKTSYLTEIASLNGTLREMVDLLSPSVVVELEPESYNVVTAGGDNVIADDSNVVTETMQITTANYAYIQDFNRYYFIESIEISTSARGYRRLYRLDLSIDVLMTYKDQIENLSPYVARNEFVYDPLLEDSAMPFQEPKEVLEYVPSAGSLVNTNLGQLSTYPMNIALNLLTDITPATGIISPPTDSELPTIDDKHYSAYHASTPYAINYDTFGWISWNIMGNQSAKATFIKSAVAFPWAITEGGLVQSYLYFGKSSDSNNRMKDANNHELRGIVTRYFSSYRVVADFTMPRADEFYEFAPWSSYEIFLPFLGWKTLDYQVVKGHRLLVYYTASYEDGSGDVYIWDFTSKRMVFSAPCQIGIKLGITSTNHQQINEERMSLGTNLAIGAITSAVGAMSGNPLAIAGGLIGGAKSISDYVVNSARLHEQANSSFSGGVGALFAPQEVKIRITNPVPTFTDIDAYAHLYGRPLRDFRTLRNLSGMTMVGDIHLDDFLALEAEKTRIVQILQSGVIL